MTDWQDRIVGARMTVDREFAPQVRESEFSNQEWGLIMTAVEFRVEDAADPEAAALVADTDAVEHVIPELDDIRADVGAMTPGGPSGDRGSSGGGFLDSVKSALGMGGEDDGDADAETLARAESLANEYARRLQAHLESEGRWEEVRTAAAQDEGHDGAGDDDESPRDGGGDHPDRAGEDRDHASGDEAGR
jgi:hypothetical protein